MNHRSTLRAGLAPGAMILRPLVVIAALGCAQAAPTLEPHTGQSAHSPPLATAQGFSGPEAVRYDPDQDVYFVANFNGRGSALDTNGFISRLRPDGTIERLRFIAGGEAGVMLHAPRGMTIVGDTLWAADVDAVRGFHRVTGAPLATIDFSGADAGFLNDIAQGPDGALYITDTGRNRIYRAANGKFTVALAGDALDRPNGITWDRAGERFIIVPYSQGEVILAWRPGTTVLDTVGRSAGGRFDGVEVLGAGRVLVASQRDSSLHLFAGGSGRPIIGTTGAPADIGVDTRRNRVAVPYIALNRVDIWQLPED